MFFLISQNLLPTQLTKAILHPLSIRLMKLQSIMEFHFPNGQVTYVSGEGLSTSAFLPLCGGLLQAQGQYPGEMKLSFSCKNKWGTRITPMLQWPDISFSLGLEQALAWKRSGLLARPTVQVSVCPTVGGSCPDLRMELTHLVKEKLNLNLGCSLVANPYVFASVSEFMQKRKKVEVFKDAADEADKKNWRKIMLEIEELGSAVAVLRNRRSKSEPLPKDLVVGTMVRIKQLKKWNLVGEGDTSEPIPSGISLHTNFTDLFGDRAHGEIECGAPSINYFRLQAMESGFYEDDVVECALQTSLMTFYFIRFCCWLLYFVGV